MKTVLALSLVVVVLGSVAGAQTYGTPFTPVSIPDNPSGSACSPLGQPATAVVTVPQGLPPVAILTLSLGITHTWYGDVVFTIEHGGTVVQLLGPANPCSGYGDSSDLNGVYTFSDAAAGSADSAVALISGSTALTPGAYLGDAGLAAFTGMDPTGQWTFTVSDLANGDTGTIFDARVSLSACNTSYTVSQSGPGAPTAIVHACGSPGNIYLSAVTLTPNALVSGWLFGLNISIYELTTEINFGPPFYGTLDGTGAASFSFAIPGGFTFSTVGVHFDAASGIPTYTSSPFTFSVL